MIVIICAEKVRIGAKHMVRLVPAEVILLIHTDKLAILPIKRPVAVLTIVTNLGAARVYEFQIALHRQGRIHPVVVRLLLPRAIVPE